MRVDRNSNVRLVWLVVGFVIFGVGFGLVWWPSSLAIGQVRVHAQQLYEEANENDAITRRASDLRAAQSRIRADLLALGGLRSRGEITAATLRLLSDEGKRFGVDVGTIGPGAAGVAQTTTRASRPARDPMLGSDLTIGIRGRFRNVVDLIADVPRHDVLIDVHDAQITSSEANQGAPKLDVTLHATIYRVTYPERTGQ